MSVPKTRSEFIPSPWIYILLLAWLQRTHAHHAAAACFLQHRITQDFGGLEFGQVIIRMEEEANPSWQVDVVKEKGHVVDSEVAVDATLLTPAVTQSQILRDLSGISDHYTLPAQSSTIRFRSSVVKVFPNRNSQFVLECDTSEMTQDKKQKMTMKSTHDSSAGLTWLRATYTLIAMFLTGVVAVFAISFFLFMITDLVIAAGGTDINQITTTGALGILLALPVSVYGMASALVFCSSFVSDTWGGSPLLKRYCFGYFSEVFFQWTLFAFFLGIPIFVYCVSLLVNSPIPWQITLLTWTTSVLTLYCFYILTIVGFETVACWNLVSSRLDSQATFWETLRGSIELHLTATYSGYKTQTYLAQGHTADTKTDEDVVFDSTFREFKGPYARLTSLGCCSKGSKFRLYETIDKPERLPQIYEIQGTRSFVTAGTWTLEKLYCHPRAERVAYVVKGEGGLNDHQLLSSILCAFVGQGLSFLLLLSILVYVGLGAAGSAIVAVVALVFWFLPNIIRAVMVCKTVRRVKGGAASVSPLSKLTKVIPPFPGKGDSDEAAEGADTSAPKEAIETESGDKDDERDPLATPTADSENMVIYQVRETYRLTKPSTWLSWLMFALECIFLFLWPIVSLFLLRNYVIAIEFVILAIFAFLRRFLNPATALREVGSLKSAHKVHDEQDWKRESRISSILDDVTLSRSRRLWMVIMAFIAIALVVLCFVTLASQAQGPSDFAVTKERFTGNFSDPALAFEYLPQRELSYPSCVIAKSFLPGIEETRLVDVAFLALMAYKDSSVLQSQLTSWFGDGVAEDMHEYVVNFRNRTESRDIAVAYHLININNTAIVTIRGTSKTWDLFTNAQLWLGAWLMQIIRLVFPFGFLWTPIIDELLYALSDLQSETISRISFYKETTAFVEHLKTDPSFTGVAVTGHSLGGGLAIITGAQTGEPAIAISGPNAVLSRLTFDPQLTVDALNKYTFNVIPDHDPVPQVDDPARLVQNIACTLDRSLFGCHSSERTLCELMYRCGSQGRPILCKCVTEFEYEKPIQRGNITFEQMCEVSDWYV